MANIRVFSDVARHRRQMSPTSTERQLLRDLRRVERGKYLHQLGEQGSETPGSPGQVGFIGQCLTEYTCVSCPPGETHSDRALSLIECFSTSPNRQEGTSCMTMAASVLQQDLTIPPLDRSVE